jgi:hypothetical protein
MIAIFPVKVQTSSTSVNESTRLTQAITERDQQLKKVRGADPMDEAGMRAWGNPVSFRAVPLRFDDSCSPEGTMWDHARRPTWLPSWPMSKTPQLYNIFLQFYFDRK